MASSSKYEQRYKDISTTDYACDTTGSVTLLNGIAVGSTASLRRGRRVCLTELHVTGRLRPSSDSFKRSRCDVLLVWDKQPGAAVPAITDILTESISGAPKNLDYRERFKILRKSTTPWEEMPKRPVPKEPTIDLIEIHEPLFACTIYKGDSNAITDIATGALYLVTIGDQAAINGASLNVAVRLRWVE